MESQYMDIVQYYAEHRTEYYLSVYLPIAIWMFITIFFIVILFRRFTFGHWTAENPNPYEGETFGMPRGTMRGILALTLLYITLILEIANVRLIGLETEIQGFMTAFQMMVAFYFGAKVMHHVTSADRTKTTVLADAEVKKNISSSVVENIYNDGISVDSTYFEEEGAAG